MSIVSILCEQFELEDAKVVWREEAMEEERENIAKRLILDNVPIDKIMEYTKLTHDEINQLIAEC